MDAKQLYQEDGGNVGGMPGYTPIGRWFCSKCRSVFVTKDSADFCCADKYCEDCGKNLGNTYASRCGDCMDLKRIEKAVTTPYTDGPVYDPETDRIFEDDADFYEHFDGEPWGEVDRWLHPCLLVKWPGIDIQSAYQQATETFFDDNEQAENQVVDQDGLFKFVAAWNEKQTLVYYETLYSKKLRLPKPSDWESG